MSQRQQTEKACVFVASNDADSGTEPLRRAAAVKLCGWHTHLAGGGSSYITIKGSETLTLRFADHENTSSQHHEPDFNFVDGISDNEVEKVLKRIDYPPTCKKTAFAMHVGLSAAKLRKLLPPNQFPDCYEKVCESAYYFNTFTEVVRVLPALAALAAQGITARIPISQEVYREEDYAGPMGR